jgi:hypothetical protein
VTDGARLARRADHRDGAGSKEAFDGPAGGDAVAFVGRFSGFGGGGDVEDHTGNRGIAVVLAGEAGTPQDTEHLGVDR